MPRQKKSRSKKQSDNWLVSPSTIRRKARRNPKDFQEMIKAFIFIIVAFIISSVLKIEGSILFSVIAFGALLLLWIVHTRRDNTADVGMGANSKFKKSHKRIDFSKSQQKEILAKQKNRCKKCRNELDMRTVEYHHIKEVHKGGKTTVKNGMALCSNCHKIETHNSHLKKVEKRKREVPTSTF